MVPIKFTIYTDIFLEASKSISNACRIRFAVNSFISSNVASKYDISTDIISELKQIITNNIITKITNMKTEGKRRWKL